MVEVANGAFKTARRATTISFATSADGAGATDTSVSGFVMWKKGRVQKRATKILSLNF